MNDRKGIALIKAVIVGIAVVLIVSMFVISYKDRAQDAVDVPISETLTYEQLYTECNAICLDDGQDITTCDLEPESSDFKCSDIIKSGGNLDDIAIHSGTVYLKKAYALDGDFRPCSTMKVVFQKDYTVISDFKIRISETETSEPVVLRNNENNIISSVDGFSELCTSEHQCAERSDGYVFTEFRLPCTEEEELEGFTEKTKYNIYFQSDPGIIPDDKMYDDSDSWTCTGMIESKEINYNQYLDEPLNVGDLKKSTVSFKDSMIIKPESDTNMNIMVAIITTGDCYHPTSGEEFDDDKCLIPPDNKAGFDYYDDLAATYSSEDGMYTFTMPKVTKDLTKIRFNVRLPIAGDETIGICSDEVSVNPCSDMPKYLCIEKENEEDETEEHIYSLKTSSVTDYTIDDLCYYSTDTLYEKGCIEVSTGEYVDEDESDCNLPDYIYIDESDSIITEDPDTCKGKDELDLVVESVEFCVDGDCSNRVHSYYEDIPDIDVIVVKLKNTGTEPIDFDKGNLHVTIDGEEVSIIEPIDGFSAGGAEDGEDAKTIDGIDATSLKSGTHLIPGTHTITARIDDIDVMKYPVVDEGTKKANNMKSMTVEVATEEESLKCNDCSNLEYTDCTSLCSYACKWAEEANSGLNTCQSR